MSTTAKGIRDRVRSELTSQILDTARRHLAAEGAAALSLRAVARELEMAPSAVYRYFPSRDSLLTALIIQAYDAIGAGAEAAVAAHVAGDDLQRFAAVCGAVRDFARRRPHEYALIFGSPVPGYKAPQETVRAAARTPLALAEVVRDAAAGGRLRPSPALSGALPAATTAEMEALADFAVPGIAPDLLARGVFVWVQLFGLVSFELFGHLVGSVDDNEAFFGWCVDSMARYVGLI